MYSFSQLCRALDDPVIIFRELNSLYNRRIRGRPCNPKGTAVLKEDWDNLILLDACRYDVFEEHHQFNGELQSRQSKGAGTKEFLKANFQNESMKDIVYVTANPQFFRHSEEINAAFHDVIHVWRDDGWDNELGTVLPETMTEYAKRAAERYPDKALIIHYLQPHLPFLGPMSHQYEELSRGFGEDGLKTPAVEREIYWQAYVETLERTLPHVEDLIAELVGKSVVTADHGQAIGERLAPFPIRDYGHWRGNYIEELIKVPWLIIESGERKNIVAERSILSTDDSTTDEQIAKQRLQQLGYLE